MPNTQNYSNHTRWNTLVHFVITPLLTLNLVWQIVRLVQETTWDRAENVVLAFTLVLLSMAARLQALKAQDRVIRLEERLRYNAVLPADQAVVASQFRTGQIIALRFASDDELSGLVSRVAAGELETSKEIKQAVKNWRGDHLRV